MEPITRTRGRVRAGAAAAGLLLLSLLCACTMGTRLETESAMPADAKGTYRLYLYGCRYPEDVEVMALLVDQTSPYPFDLYVLDTSYRVKQDLSGPAALAEAEKFIQCSLHDVWMTAFRRVIDPSGRTVAFEMKPLYFPHDVGKDEALLSSYSLKNGTVTVYLSLDPLVEKRMNSVTSQPSGN
jgi:hypothetical protein